MKKLLLQGVASGLWPEIAGFAADSSGHILDATRFEEESDYNFSFIL
jgi:hypothetical protein